LGLSHAYSHRQLFDLAKGLCYLHSCGVVHGDLKGARSSSKYHFIILTPGQPNVLVDDSGHIRIGDFGLATVTRNLDSSRSASNHLSHTPRWAAPEILGGGKPSKEADVFSFAMVTIEVCHGQRIMSTALAHCRFVLAQIFTGAIPFVNEITVTAMLFTVQGKRPPRPLHPTFTEDLWTLIQCCWDQEPFSRPKISEVALQLLTLSVCNRLTGHTLTTHDHVSLIEAIFLGDDRVQIESVPREGAQTLIDVIDEVGPYTTPRSKDRLIDLDSNLRILLIRRWGASHQRPAGGAYAFYTGFAATKFSSHDHWQFRFVTSQQRTRCTVMNLGTFGRVTMVAGRLLPRF